ncbi:hypothetical protein [Noviherbaspirillum pedocola]|uniref:Uncharacterized protein n=1 Tax=Noviherbaspirillum pedocola TaxID=2801341 RepID=A0A934SW32_9BURK|nr:hypothetical protein [Noviherbaspirillum pedocola]MBK4736191.1 hypothetical protein [Noviherbaspirillum pedocola]
MRGNHHIVGRNEAPEWPAIHIASDGERVILARYRIAPVSLAAVAWLDDKDRAMCAKRRPVGIYRGDELVAIARDVFSVDETKVYLANGMRRKVLFGVAGEELTNYDRSILVVHEMLCEASLTEDCQ